MADQNLLQALAALTTGNYVLSVREGEQRHGMSASWVTQVSGQPPLLMAAVDQRHGTHDLLARTGRFALNVVGERGRPLENDFFSAAARRPDNLEAIAWYDSPAGPPYLLEAAGSLEAGGIRQHSRGDPTPAGP